MFTAADSDKLCARDSAETATTTASDRRALSIDRTIGEPIEDESARPIRLNRGADELVCQPKRAAPLVELDWIGFDRIRLDPLLSLDSRRIGQDRSGSAISRRVVFLWAERITGHVLCPKRSHTHSDVDPTRSNRLRQRRDGRRAPARVAKRKLVARSISTGNKQTNNYVRATLRSPGEKVHKGASL